MGKSFPARTILIVLPSILGYMEEKLQEILSQAADLFKKYGLKSISMDDMAQHLGISKKTLYKYVSGKEDLIVQVVEFERQKIKQQFQSIPQEGMNAIDILLEHSRIVNRIYEDTNPAFMFDIRKYHHALEETCFEKTNETIYKTIRKNIELGIKQGIYRDNLDIEMTALLYTKKIQTIHRDQQGGKLTYTPEQMFRVMMENHIMGIATEKGRKYFMEKKKKLNIQ